MRFIKIFEDFSDADVSIPSDYIDFIDYLKKYGAPLELYGTGHHKTIGHLWNEIGEGETDLRVENGKLVRRVSFVGARIIYKLNGKWIRLYETKQVFKDGRVRKRESMPYSMAEKFKVGEDPKEVIIRGMKEELDLSITKEQFTFYNKVEVGDNDNAGGKEMMIDYPGVQSYHTGHEFLVVLSEEQYTAEGYIERQSDKDVHFGWRPMRNSSLRESFIFESDGEKPVERYFEENPEEFEKYANSDKIKNAVSAYIERQSATFGFFMHDNKKLLFKEISDFSIAEDQYIVKGKFETGSGVEHEIGFIVDDKFKVRGVETIY